VDPCTLHFCLLKSDIPNHVSSIFMKFFFCCTSSRNWIAYCYRKTRFFIEFTWIEHRLIFLYLILLSWYIISLISFTLAFSPNSSFSILFVDSTESRKVSLSFNSYMCLLSLSLLVCLSSLSLTSSFKNSVFFFTLSTIEWTTLILTLW